MNTCCSTPYHASTHIAVSAEHHDKDTGLDSLKQKMYVGRKMGLLLDTLVFDEPTLYKFVMTALVA